MGCVIAVVVWAGTPLYTMTFLAGLQAIPKELYEAAEIDGASVVQQFFYVTMPRLRPIFLTTVMLSTIWTATNLQFVFVLTRGGPANRTEIFPHLAYMTALGARRLGMGAAVSLVFFPGPGRADRAPDPPDAPADGRLDALGHAGTRRLLKWIGNGLLVVMLVWTLVPFYWMIATSLKKDKEIYGFEATLSRGSPTLSNYTRSCSRRRRS